MKTKYLCTFCFILLHSSFCLRGNAQSTAFTYQGRLNDGANPANGTYDLAFALFSVSNGAGQIGGTLTNSATSLTNGLFTVTLDFGSQFPGANRWLEIGVRTNGGGVFAALTPRQQITPTPYAIFAGAVGTNGLAAGTYANAVTLNNAANSFSGNGTGLTNVNAATLGGLGAANFWIVGGNAGTGGAGLGTVDNQPLKLIAGNRRVLQLETKSVSLGGFDSFLAVNTLGGASGNIISNGILGGTIAGGGAVTNHLFGSEAAPNSVLDNFGTVGGGINNTAGYANTDFDEARGATVAGGENNTAGGPWATVGGGSLNNASVLATTVGGGFGNTANGGFATIAGGYGNTASGDGATVPGGYGNHATGSASFAAGFNAYATNDGTFVWADSTGGIFASSGNNQFLVRASGGVGIGTTAPGQLLQVGDQFNTPGSQGMIRLASRSGIGPAARYWDIGVPEGDENTAGKFYSFVIDDPQLGTAPELVIRWDTGNVGIGTTNPTAKLHVIGNILASGTITGSSDRNVKEHFSSVNPRDVLEKVSALPITEWNYISDGATLRHIGPMAQDFYSAFNVGLDDKHISMVDADGVALAAIQGLNEKLEVRSQRSEDRSQQLETRSRKLEDRLQQKETEIMELKARLEKLERLLPATNTKGE